MLRLGRRGVAGKTCSLTTSRFLLRFGALKSSSLNSLGLLASTGGLLVPTGALLVVGRRLLVLTGGLTGRRG